MPIIIQVNWYQFLHVFIVTIDAKNLINLAPKYAVSCV